MTAHGLLIAACTDSRAAWVCDLTSGAGFVYGTVVSI